MDKKDTSYYKIYEGFYLVLGIKLSRISDYNSAYNVIKNSIETPSKYITLNNAHTIVESVRDSTYKKAINKSFLSLPDGRPLSLYAKLKKEKNINRIFGPTLLEKTLEWGQNDNLKHYFFGNSEKTLSKMKMNLYNKYPHAIVAGFFSPPFKSSFSEEENKIFIERMNKSGADIFWISLGAPKQELWMYENMKQLDRGVMIGIGAGFDYLAGNIKHAPEWMKNWSFEWSYRLWQEPKRLWKRYLVANTLFIWFVFLEMIRVRRFYL